MWRLFPNAEVVLSVVGGELVNGRMALMNAVPAK